jgi:hypothetical protein
MIAASRQDFDAAQNALALLRTTTYPVAGRR